MKQRFIIERKNERRADVLARAHRALDEAARDGDVMVVLDEVKRTLDQNAAMWPALTDFAKQVQWPVVQRDGKVRQADAYDMKDILTAAFEEETRMAPGLRGGTVMLGARTSKYSKRKMADFLTFLRAEGNDRGVVWSEKAHDRFEEYIDGRRAA